MRLPLMRLAGISAVAAPLCMFCYGVIRILGRADGRYGPGLDWQAAHAAYLVGLVFLVPLFVGLRQLLRPGWGRELAVATALVGTVAFIVQFTVDIVVGFLAADEDELATIGDRFTEVPGVPLVFYEVGPQLLFVGLFVLVVMLVRAGQASWWMPVLIAAGVIPIIDLNLLPLAALCYLAALAPLASRLRQVATPNGSASRGDQTPVRGGAGHHAASEGQQRRLHD